MGRQYYCEFCEKSFADNPSSRKNHLNGTQHKVKRQNYYNLFQDPETRLQSERNKRPCKNFPRGLCNFGDNCRFSHMTVDDFAQLEQEVLLSRRLKMEPPPPKKEKIEASVKEIDLTLPIYSLPPILQNIPTIPPSLLPPPPDVFKDLKPQEWG